MSVSTAGFRRAGAGWGFLVVLVGLLGGNQARGAGFLIYDLSGEALGKASAVSASTSEPAAVWFNPAALAFAPSGVSLGSVLVVADSEFEPEGGGPRTDTEGGVFVLPTVFANARVHQRVALALGVFPAFGLSIKWPEAWIGRESAIKASITTVNVNPTVAVQLLPRLSLGRVFRRCGRRWSSSTDCRLRWVGPPVWAAAPGATAATWPCSFAPCPKPCTWRSAIAAG